MTEILRSEDCGNSPKNLLVQELSIALATRDLPLLLDNCADDVTWEILGRGRGDSQSDLTVLLDDRPEPARLAIHHVVTHGKAGAVDGTAEFANGAKQHFCDIYEFTGASGKSIQAITSYVIEDGP
jgi:hypothetical protein